MAAEQFKTDHTEFRVSPSAIDLIDTLVWHHDGPFGDSSAVPTYLVSKLTREHVTVVLTGDGGDELFAGYLRFYAALLAERIPAAAGRAASGVLALRAAAAERAALAGAGAAILPVDGAAAARSRDAVERAVLRRSRGAAASGFRRRPGADRQAAAHRRRARDDVRAFAAEPAAARQLHVLPRRRSAGEDRSLHDGQLARGAIAVSRPRADRVRRRRCPTI